MKAADVSEMRKGADMANDMMYVTLSNGVKMPQLGYGVYQVTQDECERCVRDALEVGYRHIDTAQSYFNEERVGSAIAAATDGDIFEITPEQPYSNADLNWRDDSSRVTREHNDQSLRDIPLLQATPDAFEEYETVFVGYPIWWQMAAWPVNRFVRDNDFVRKTVIPFCTSSSSSMDSTRQALEQLAGSGEWLDGQRFGENPQDGVVESWVESLGM